MMSGFGMTFNFVVVFFQDSRDVSSDSEEEGADSEKRRKVDSKYASLLLRIPT